MNAVCTQCKWAEPDPTATPAGPLGPCPECGGRLARDMRCPICETVFTCTEGHDKPHQCWSCWYTLEIAKARKRFLPLIRALEDLGVPAKAIDVYQSGGMVMLLSVDLGGERRAMFSEWDESDRETGVGLYRDWNDPDDEGQWVSTDAIPYHPDHAGQIAAWVVPLINDWKEGDHAATA